jgi:ABC-type nitrate/sulfonate/bicarbonate transport system permease component
MKAALNNKWVHRVVVWAALLMLWDAAAVQAGEFYLPRVGDVIGAMARAFSDGTAGTLLTSMRQMLGGFALAALVGIPLGLLIGSSWVADRLLSVYVKALYVTSLEAVIPILIALFGTRFQFRLSVVFLFAFTHIALNTIAGVRAINPTYLDTARAFCAPMGKRAVYVLMPAVLPYIMTGLRLGLASAFKGMIIAELWILVDTGRLLTDLSAAHALPELFAAVLLIMGFSLLSNRLLFAVQKWIAPWA